MSTSKTKSSGQKFKELNKVISIQEKTIQRLQKVLEKNNNEKSNSIKKNSEEKNTPRSTKRSTRRTDIDKKRQHSKRRTSSSSINQKQEDSKKINTKSSKIGFEFQQNPTEEIHRMRENNNSALTTLTNQQSQIRLYQNDCHMEIQNLKDQVSRLRIEYESQKREQYEIELIHQCKQREIEVKLQESLMQNNLYEEKIKKLEGEIEYERNEYKILNNEFQRQRNTWQELYYDISNELKGLKAEISQIENIDKANNRENSKNPFNFRQNSEALNKFYQQYRQQIDANN